MQEQPKLFHILLFGMFIYIYNMYYADEYDRTCAVALFLVSHETLKSTGFIDWEIGML